MDAFVGPLAVGRRVVMLAVAVGIGVAATLWTVGRALGVPLPPSFRPILLVAGVFLGFVLVFLGYALSSS